MPTETFIDATEAFDLLKTERRRTLLHLLPAEEGEMTVRTLALHLTLSECDDDPATVDDASYRRIFTSLHHIDLPKLADAGVVEYDTETGAVSRGVAAPELEAYLP